MQLFQIDFDEYESLAMFADSLERAKYLVDIFLTFNFADGTSFEVNHPVAPPYITADEHREILEASAQNIQGIGIYHPLTGWQIVRVWEYPLTRKRKY